MCLRRHEIIVISNSIRNVYISLTMTSNLNWPVIKNALFQGQIPSNIPDICTRVFKIKQCMLIQCCKGEKNFNLYRICLLQQVVQIIKFPVNWTVVKSRLLTVETKFYHIPDSRLTSSECALGISLASLPGRCRLS